MVPQFAFANFAHSIDAAFISFDPSSNTDAIVHACEVAAHIFTATVVSTSDLGDIPIPRGYQRAISGPHAERWSMGETYAGAFRAHRADQIASSPVRS